MSNDVEQTLLDRKITHGDFKIQSEISQELKNTFFHHINRERLNYPMVESIEMILHKLARIGAGNPYYIDSWRDIAGYATLVVDYLKSNEYAVDCKVERFEVNAKN